jgi:protein tyrosine kinase modulator
MLGHRELSVDDYLTILRRRKWLILVPALLGPLIAYGIAVELPSRYLSQTLVLIEQQKVPSNYVEPVVTEDLNARLATMQEQILSRTRLQPEIERYHLYADARGNPTMEELVERMRDDISVTPVKSLTGRQGSLPGFTISFTASDPRVAQQVCAEITSMFIEESLRQNQQSAQSTTNFLVTQLEDAKRKLDAQDAKLAQFKRRYIGALPDETQTNLNILASLNTQLAAVTQALNRTQQDKTYTESLLAQQVASQDALNSVNGPRPEKLQDDIADKEAQLVALQARYTPDYPDIIKLKDEIARLKKQSQRDTAKEETSAEQKSANAGLPEPPQTQQLRSRIQAYDQAVKNYTKEQGQLEDQIKLYQSRIQLSPIVEQEYKEITRDYQTALDFYNDLLKKKNQSEMATDLERRQQGEQFRILDPANLPEKPSFPNRPLFAMGGLAVGLFGGLGLAFLFEARDKSLRNELDVESCLGVPTLAVVPRLRMAGNGKRAWPRWIEAAKNRVHQARQSTGV